MDPSAYNGKEWTELLRQMTPRQIRNSLKRAYRAEAKKAREMAVRSLRSRGPEVRGNARDWDNGVRSHIYSRGGGFLLTVKPRKAGKGGKGEKSMHTNRRGITKPVLLWAEEGTRQRATRSSSRFAARKRKGHPTGRMPAYGFLAAAEGEIGRMVEADLGKEVRVAVEKVAKKCGFL